MGSVPYFPKVGDSHDVAAAIRAYGACIRSAEEYTDIRPLFKGFPDDRCPDVIKRNAASAQTAPTYDVYKRC